LKLIKIIWLLGLSCAFVFGGIGSSGAQFMQIGAGTKAIGMGSAYTAYAEGIDAIYWNPAGLVSLENNTHFSIGHVNYFADMSFDNIAFTMPMFNGVIGFSGIGLFSGDIEITTVEEPEGTNETYTANEYAIGITYSTKLTDKFSAGVTLKLIHQGLAELSADGWAMDLGAVYNTKIFNNLRFGFAILNFGPDLRYEGDDLIFRTRKDQDQISQDEDARAQYVTELYQLPLRLQIGIAIDVINMENQKIVATLDGINPNDQTETFGAGLEYTLFNRISLRAGYSKINEKDLTAGLSAMVGDPAETAMIVNYAYENHEYLGELHRFGIDFSF